MASWLSGLANKAEDMLNSVDKVAATTLSRTAESNEHQYPAQWRTQPASNKLPSASYTSQLNKDNSGTKKTDRPSYPSPDSMTSSMTSSSSVPSNLNKMNDSSNGSTGMSRSFHAQTNSKKKDSDDELFEFLNSSDTLDGNGSSGGTKRKDKVSGLRTANLNNGHSRQSSSSSVSSQRSGKTPEAPTVINMTESSELQGSGTATPEQTVKEVEDAEIMAPNLQNIRQEMPDTHHEKSSLELQNHLLSNEVASLNGEMASVIKRAKESQEELNKVKRKLDNQSSQLSTQDGIIRELRARENDLSEALGAKDSQLAILRVRFEEGEKELVEKKKVIDELKGETHRILNDHTSVSGAQNQALDGLKSKLSESENAFKREQDMHQQALKEATEQQSKLQAQIQTLSESLTNAERRMNDERTRVSELTVQFKTAKSQADIAKQELSEYKEKAARILQSKDRLISSLKEGTEGEPGDAGSASLAELELARQERDLIREELQQGRMTIESLRTEIQDLELTLQTDQETAADSQRHLEEQLNTEKSRREDAEQEVGRQKQELRYAHEELINQKTGHKRQLQDRDIEIDRLRNQLTTKSANSNSQTELENRLHALTESLIHKQTMVEALSTEKNSLVLQLERLEQKYNILQETSARTHTTAVHMHDDDETRQRLPGFMRESPLDGDVARRMKRAASAIDKFSIRLGVFLRRYPIARVFVICYMALLHVWVMVVLLTYQPEIHGHDFAPQAP